MGWFGPVGQFRVHEFLLQWTLVIVNAWIVNNLSLVNIFGETGRLFYNINYMLNSKHLISKQNWLQNRVHYYQSISRVLLAYDLIFLWKSSNSKFYDTFGILSINNFNMYLKFRRKMHSKCCKRGAKKRMLLPCWKLWQKLSKQIPS